VQEYHSVPLSVAAEMGYTDTVGRLLKGGANINDTDKVRDISISRIKHLEILTALSALCSLAIQHSTQPPTKDMWQWFSCYYRNVLMSAFLMWYVSEDGLSVLRGY